MAESPDDQRVDEAITRMQALIDELKGAQSKDVQDEEPEPKSLQEASVRVREHFRKARRSAS